MSGPHRPVVHPSTQSAGLRRGYVGVVPADAGDARDLAHWHRITRLDVRPCAWRADRRHSLRLVAQALARHTDYALLLTRPGHELIAAETGLSIKTVQRRIDDMHQLRWIITTEVGTTERIRAGRLRGGHDPHEGNRAQEYRLVIPAVVIAPIGNVADQRKKLSVHPSPHIRRMLGGSITTSRRKASTGTYTRARTQWCDHAQPRPQAAGNPKQHPRTRRGRPAWLARAADVTAVWQALPAALTEHLAVHEADRLATAIAAELTYRSVDELADRIARHWDYWRYKLAAGLVRSPIAVAIRIVRRDFDCPDVRCEDRWQLDTDRSCAACQERATATLATRTASQSGEQRPTEANRPTDAGQAVCGAVSAPPVAKILAPVVHGAAERGAPLARRLLGVRDPAERERIISEYRGTGPYDVKDADRGGSAA